MFKVYVMGLALSLLCHDQLLAQAVEQEVKQLANDDAEKLKLNAEACTCFEAMFANMSAWSSGDFLVRRTATFDNVGSVEDESDVGQLVKDTRYDRVIFDFDEVKFCWLRMDEREKTDFSKNPPAKKTLISVSGYCISGPGKPCLARVFPNKTHRQANKINKATLFDFLKSIGSPDYRGVGLTEDGFSDSFDTAKYLIKLYKPGNLLVSSEQSNKSTELLIKLSIDESRMETYREYVVSPDTFMPLKSKIWYRLPDESGKMVRRKGIETSFKWTEVNGVSVPSSVRTTQGTAISFGGKQAIGEQFIDIDFHWFSLNEPDKLPDVFEGRPLKDMETFQSYTNPRKAGADSLISDSKENEERKK